VPKRGRGIPHRTVNKEARLEKGGAVANAQTRSRKLVKAVVGGKLHRRGGNTHIPHEL
jgi:hypothetical protein